MQKPTFDPGLTQQFTGVLRRSINKDGSFNVYRRGGSWRDFHPYLHMLNMSWPRFFGAILGAYLLLNLLFALVYFALGPSHLQGANGATEMDRFLNDFFFSTHTLTTVGYGNMVPATVMSNVVASLEAIAGLMAVALGTGLMFGRFSRPSAKIAFSESILMAPYQEQTSLQFRVVNLRPNILMELEANLVLMTVEGPPGQMTRRFVTLKLERDKVYFLPLTWTIVHPIDETSPLYGKTYADLERLQAEFVALIKGFDDTFSQTVHSRYSYRYDEIRWQAKFQPAFEINAAGNMILDVDRVGSHALLSEAASSGS
ncbi:MAG: ion channel [Acidobacteriota bacterium]|nr:ion channel [Acidobacteriota bacterium]